MPGVKLQSPAEAYHEWFTLRGWVERDARETSYCQSPRDALCWWQRGLQSWVHSRRVYFQWPLDSASLTIIRKDWMLYILRAIPEAGICLILGRVSVCEKLKPDRLAPPITPWWRSTRSHRPPLGGVWTATQTSWPRRPSSEEWLPRDWLIRRLASTSRPHLMSPRKVECETFQIYLNLICLQRMSPLRCSIWLSRGSLTTWRLLDIYTTINIATTTRAYT